MLACILYCVQKVTELACEKGWPRLYISANSGARLGLAEEIRNLFQVAWIDPTDPDRVS